MIVLTKLFSSRCLIMLLSNQRLFALGQNFLSKRLPKLELFTKTPCVLCDEALLEISPLFHKVSYLLIIQEMFFSLIYTFVQFDLVKIDISKMENIHWWHKYKYDIPVFHFEGKFLMKHKANVSALQFALDDYYRK